MTGLLGDYSRTTLAPMLRTPSAYRVPMVSMGGGGGFNLAKFLGGAAKVGGFLANPLVGAGIGLLGGILGGRRAAQRTTSMMPEGMTSFMRQLEQPDISQFRDIARQAAPSYQDLSRLSAATGGSMAGANAQAMQGQVGAMDAALRAYQQQQQSNQGMIANMYGQQYAAMQGDQAFRRQTGVDIFSNIASLGSGLLGQAYGNRFQQQQNTSFFNMLDAYNQSNR
jgi:hypothetical protein